MRKCTRYYAIESLPALLGDRQFKLLCTALGLNAHKFNERHRKRAGDVFAEFVEAAATKNSKSRRTAEPEGL